MPYQDVYGVVEQISGKVLIDKEKTNYALFSRIADAKETDVFPTTVRKAIKNAVEIRNMKKRTSRTAWQWSDLCAISKRESARRR